MQDYLKQWLSRKQERPQLSIHEKRSARFKFTRALGPRGQFAVVYLRGEPATEFSFASVAEWPGPKCVCTLTVLDGVLDKLLALNLGPVPARVQFTLEKIECHDVDSSAVAFYHAARGAVRESLGRDQYPGNIDYRELTNG
jgi:hypothetical protein